MQTVASNQSCDEVSQVSAAQRRSSAPKLAVLSPSAKSWKAFAFGYCIAMVVANLSYLTSFANPEIPYCSPTEVQQLMHKDDSPKPVPMTAFEKIVQFAYNHTFQEVPTLTPKKFDVQTWEHKSGGALNDADRIMLARIYGEATSETVLHYRLGFAINSGKLNAVSILQATTTNHLFDVEFSAKELCAYRRRLNTMDEQLVDYWKHAFLQVN